MFMLSQNILPLFGKALFHSLWQMGLLLALYYFITAVIFRSSPEFRKKLAVGMLGTGFIWFLLTALGIFSYTWPDRIASSLVVNAKQVLSGSPFDLEMIIIGLYFFFFILQLRSFIKKCRYINVISKEGLLAPPMELSETVTKLASKNGVSRNIGLWFSEYITTPITIGFLKPLILFPVAAMSHLSMQQAEAVLMHELAHIRRHDYLINLVAQMLRTVLYFNPFVIILVNIIEKEREFGCDDLVLRNKFTALDYSEALLALEQHSFRPVFFALPVSGNKNHLLRRIERIHGLGKNRLAAGKTILRSLCTAFIAVVIFAYGTQKHQPAQASFSFPLHADISSRPVIAANTGVHDIVLQDEKKLKGIPAAITDPVPPASINLALPGYTNADMKEMIMPELTSRQEKELNKGMDAIKKVYEASQWDKIEKNLDRKYSQETKDSLKNVFSSGIEQNNWDALTDKIRLNINTINWEPLEDKLANELARIQMDSLVKVTEKAIASYDQAEKVLNENKLKAIPDTDISLQLLKKNQRSAKASLDKILSIRRKKIVHI